MQPHKKFYVNVYTKFWISHAFSMAWLIFSVYLSLPWLHELSSIVSLPVAIVIIGGIAYIPGYMNAFLVISLLIEIGSFYFRKPILHNFKDITSAHR